MGLFKKKEEDEGEDIEGLEDDEKFLADDAKEAKPDEMNVTAEVIKLKANVESFAEIRKSTQERFTRITEQIGELRGMIMDTNKSVQEMEVKVVKSVDLVESVQPDKLMIEVKRQDAKIEGMGAKIESNKSLLDTVMEDMKGVRRQINAFRGIEEVTKLNDDVKKELREIEKVKATVERHSDKAETLFVEIQKKVTDFDNLYARVKDLDKEFNRITQDFDALKIKFANKSDKKEVEDLIGKFGKFENHYGKVVELLSKQTEDLKKFFDDRIKEKFDEAEKMRKMLIDLSHENPNLDKNLDTIKGMAAEENAKTAAEKKENEGKEGDKKEEEKGLMGKVKGMFGGSKEEEEKVEIPDNIGAGDDKPVEEKKEEGKEEEKAAS